MLCVGPKRSSDDEEMVIGSPVGRELPCWGSSSSEEMVKWSGIGRHRAVWNNASSCISSSSDDDDEMVIVPQVGRELACWGTGMKRVRAVVNKGLVSSSASDESCEGT